MGAVQYEEYVLYGVWGEGEGGVGVSTANGVGSGCVDLRWSLSEVEEGGGQRRDVDTCDSV